MVKHRTSIERIKRWPSPELEKLDWIDGSKLFTIERIDQIIKTVGVDLPSSKIPHKRLVDFTPVDCLADRREALRDRLIWVTRGWITDTKFSRAPSFEEQSEAYAHIVELSASLLCALGVLSESEARQSERRIRRAQTASSWHEIESLLQMPDVIGIGLDDAIAEWAMRYGNPIGWDISHQESDGHFVVGLNESAGARCWAVLGIALLRSWATIAAKKPWLRRRSVRGRPKDAGLRYLFRCLPGIWQDVWGRQPKVWIADQSSPRRGQPGGPFFRFCREVVDTLPIQPRLTDHAIRDRIRKRNPRPARMGQIASDLS